MKNRIKTYSIILCIFAFIGCTACNDSVDVEQKEEPIILFAITEKVPGEDGSAFIYADNKGNIYYDYIYEPLIPMLEEEKYVFGEIVGQIPGEEVLQNYQKFSEMPENLCMEQLDVIGAAPDEVIQNYYVITYGNDHIEAQKLWTYSESILLLGHEDAEEIIVWMDGWEWKLEQEGWDETTQQWYPNSDWSCLYSAPGHFK